MTYSTIGVRGIGDNITEPKWYDLTISKEKARTLYGIETVEHLGSVLERQGAERYVIGDEVGADGYEHYQVRVVFSKGKEMAFMTKSWGPVGHVSVTHVRDFHYCEKEGKFYRSWEKVLHGYVTKELRPWQGQVVAMLGEQNDREIVVIYDPKGNHGKTWLGKYLVATRRAEYVPPLQEAQDYMAMCMEKPAKAYLFDIPRASTAKQGKAIWSAIEQIKNGYLYDKRYKWRDMWIESPAIVVFTNEIPDTNLLTADRWKVYTFDQWGGTDVLIPYTTDNYD